MLVTETSDQEQTAESFLGNAFDIADDRFVLDVLRHQSGHLQISNRFLPEFDVVFLIFFDFAKTDVLDIRPATCLVVSVPDARPYSLELRGPFLD
jgi:hypothetical protein